MNLLPPEPAQSQTPVNLLIVDDVPQNLVAMQALLQREGVNLLLAGSGAQALELRAPEAVAPKLAAALSTVRRFVAPLEEDRSLSAELRALGAAVERGELAGLLTET